MFPSALTASRFAPLDMRILTSLRWPQVAAAWSGVHFSLSSAFTLALYSRRRSSMASLLSMQHWWRAVRPSSLHESGLTPFINRRLTSSMSFLAAASSRTTLSLK
jgi:hypothetical protein